VRSTQILLACRARGLEKEIKTEKDVNTRMKKETNEVRKKSDGLSAEIALQNKKAGDVKLSAEVCVCVCVCVFVLCVCVCLCACM
jgi:hypothetical protein